MSDPRFKKPATDSGGFLFVSPALPPAPPLSGQQSLSSGSLSPDPEATGSLVLGFLFTECYAEVARLASIFKALAELSEDEAAGWETAMRPRREEARERLIDRLHEIDRRIAGGPNAVPQAELRQFHRAMSELMRHGVAWKVLDPDLGCPEHVRSGGGTVTFRYLLPLRYPHEDPGKLSPATLLRRILKDLIDQLSTESVLTSVEQFDQSVYQKFRGILFACRHRSGPTIDARD
jgi:hypothetical protein